MSFYDQKIVLVSTLDTKGEESAYLKKRLENAGRRVCVIDIGTAGTPAFHADITRETVLEQTTLTQQSAGVSVVLESITAGLEIILRDLLDRDDISAVVGIGGGKGASVFHRATVGLPYGFPKLLITSARPAMLAEIAMTTDTILLPTLVDLFGVNKFIRAVLDNAASMLSGLNWIAEKEISAKTVAVTAFGVTTPAVRAIKSNLEQAGIAVIVFPANGAGGRMMEALIARSAFDGVVDLTTTEMADLLLGGTASAGEERLKAASAIGIPQVIAPGAIDMVNFGPPETVPDTFSDRTKYQHTPLTTLVRTTPADTAQIAKMTSERLNLASGAVVVFWPGGGVSDYDSPGQEFYDPAANTAWLNEMRRSLNSTVNLIETDYHINHPNFAALCSEWMITQLEMRA